MIDKITMLIAVDKNNGIGLNGGLAWSIPEDLKHFKETTINSIVIVGHETFKKLPVFNDRYLIVISRTPSDVKLRNLNECAVDSVEGALRASERMFGNCKGLNTEIFVIGGKQIYEMFQPHYTNCIVSRIEDIYETDINISDEIFKGFIGYKSKILVPDSVTVIYGVKSK